MLFWLDTKIALYIFWDPLVARELEGVRETEECSIKDCTWPISLNPSLCRHEQWIHRKVYEYIVVFCDQLCITLVSQFIFISLLVFIMTSFHCSQQIVTFVIYEHYTPTSHLLLVAACYQRPTPSTLSRLSCGSIVVTPLTSSEGWWYWSSVVRRGRFQYRLMLHTARLV